jgi:NADH-quinone oxidoreductase subunit N
MMVLLALGLGVTAILAVLAVRRSAIAAFLMSGVALLGAFAAIPRAGSAGGLFAFSSAALAFCALILVSALLILAISAAYWRRQTPVPREEFPLLLLIASFGAVVLAASNNFITLFLGLETMTLAMIGMIAYPRFRAQAGEAALKYLVLSGMSSAFLLFGIGLIEFCTGSLDFSRNLGWVAPDVASRTLAIAGLAMIGIGAAFKLSVVPFHIWVPDIYGGAPAPSGAFLAVIAKIAPLAVLIRILGQAPVPADMVTVITVIAMLSMLAGNLLALLQENFKRLLGYSSIAHLGYLLVAILAAGNIGRAAAVFYLVTYALTMIAAFGAVSALSDATAQNDGASIAGLSGLFWRRPVAACVITLALLSLARVPPAIGFIAKMYLFAACIHTQLWYLTSVMVVSSVIGLFYYLNIILVMSMRTGDAPPVAAMPVVSRVVMAAVGLPMLVFGIMPQPLMVFLQAWI